jgi:hypothetical protein
MTELQLYKFMNKNNIEYHNNISKKNDYIVFIDFNNLSEFCELCEYNFFDDGGQDVILKKGYICIYASVICDYFGIEINNVFTNERS